MLDDQEVEAIQGSTDDHQDDNEKAKSGKDRSRPRTHRKTSRDGLIDRRERHVATRERDVETIAGSREPPPEKDRRWVPLVEVDYANDELQQVPALSEHADLALENGLRHQTIHILGAGSIGKYIAQALAGLPEAPTVTLLMHRPLLMQQWHEEGAKIQLLKNGQIITTSNVNIESSADFLRESPTQRFVGFGDNLEHTAEQPDTVIDHLIVTTEGHITVAAMSAIRHRLRPTSTICYIQDGMGVANLVDSELFPNPAWRPSHLLGNISHDFMSTERKFTFIEKRPGSIRLMMAPKNLSIQETNPDFKKGGPLIKRMNYQWTPTATYLMRTLIRAPELGVIGLPQAKFYENQLLKLAVNAVIGPLSVMYDCFNDELLCNYQVSCSMKLLLKEISKILRNLPEMLRIMPGASRVAMIDKKFSTDKLEAVVVGVLTKTGKNASPMLQAVRQGKRTDIDFYSGYLIRRAKELGIDCPHLEMMMVLVKGKQAMKSREKNCFIPFKP